MICPRCGAVVEHHDARCPSCSFDLRLLDDGDDCSGDRCERCRCCLDDRPAIEVDDFNVRGISRRNCSIYCYSCAKKIVTHLEAELALTNERLLAPRIAEYKRLAAAREGWEQRRKEFLSHQRYKKIFWTLGIAITLGLFGAWIISIFVLFYSFLFFYFSNPEHQLQAFLARDAEPPKPIRPRSLNPPILHRLVESDKERQGRLSRHQVLDRDSYKCQWCGEQGKSETLEVHHVIPRAKGGNDAPTNLVTLCKKCHMKENWYGHVHKQAGKTESERKGLDRQVAAAAEIEQQNEYKDQEIPQLSSLNARKGLAVKQNAATAARCAKPWGIGASVIVLFASWPIYLDTSLANWLASVTIGIIFFAGVAFLLAWAVCAIRQKRSANTSQAGANSYRKVSHTRAPSAVTEQEAETQQVMAEPGFYSNLSSRLVLVTVILVLVSFVILIGLQENATIQQSAEKPSPVPIYEQAPLEVLSWTCDRSTAWIYITGEVKNISMAPLDGVEAVVEFRNSDGDLVNISDRLLYAGAIPAGQTLPFEVGTFDNRQISLCYLSFRHASGGNIPYTTTFDRTTEAQRLLSRLGYSPGEADGISGPKTRRAVRAFQRDVGLMQDGLITESLLQQLRWLSR